MWGKKFIKMKEERRNNLGPFEFFDFISSTVFYVDGKDYLTLHPRSIRFYSELNEHVKWWTNMDRTTGRDFSAFINTCVQMHI